MKILRYLLLPALLLTLAGCKKKEDTPAPSKAALLTAHTWKESTTSLVINGYEGTTASTGTETISFTSDGKLLETKQGSTTPTQDGTWQLASNDTQLVLTPTTGTSTTYQLFDLTATKLSIGFAYDQATIAQRVAASGSNDVKTLLLAAGSFTFPANTPTFTPDKVISLQFKINLISN